jgi:hypothetical protein
LQALALKLKGIREPALLLECIRKITRYIGELVELRAVICQPVLQRQSSLGLDVTQSSWVMAILATSAPSVFERCAQKRLQQL